jgi:hypothetical protein
MVTPLLVLLVAAAAAASPSPSPSPSPDPCGGATTNLLAALNRPTIGFSACAVKPHESVWEFGYNNVAQSDGSHIAIYPQSFIRFALARRLEFDVIAPLYAVQQFQGTVQRGFLDSGIGAKYEFFHDESSVAAADLLYSIPTGATNFTAGAPIATLNLDYGRALSPVSGFATTIGIQSSYAQDFNGRSARFTSLVPSVAFTTQTNQRTQFYVEAFGQTRIRPDGGTLFGINGGIQYLLLPCLELDAELGQTSTDLAHAHYLGFGLGLKL